MTRVRLIAQRARWELVARGTPCAPLAATDELLRRQLAIWLPMLRMQLPTRVRRGPTLVIPVKEEEPVKEEADGAAGRAER